MSKSGADAGSLSWRRERRETPSHSGFSKILRDLADVVFPGIGLTKRINKLYESLCRIYKTNIIIRSRLPNYF